MSSNVPTHQRMHTVTGVRSFGCDICNKGFTNESNLRRHQVLHTGEGRYICQICDKSFSFTSSLRNHQVVHSGARPFGCHICNKYLLRNRIYVHNS